MMKQDEGFPEEDQPEVEDYDMGYPPDWKEMSCRDKALFFLEGEYNRDPGAAVLTYELTGLTYAVLALGQKKWWEFWK